MLHRASSTAMAITREIMRALERLVAARVAPSVVAWLGTFRSCVDTGSTR